MKKNISEQNDGISSEIIPSFRTEAVEDRDVLFREMKFVLSNFLFEKKNSEQNDEISSEILPSLRTEALEDRDVIFNQSQVS